MLKIGNREFFKYNEDLEPYYKFFRGMKVGDETLLSEITPGLLNTITSFKVTDESGKAPKCEISLSHSYDSISLSGFQRQRPVPSDYYFPPAPPKEDKFTNDITIVAGYRRAAFKTVKIIKVDDKYVASSNPSDILSVPIPAESVVFRGKSVGVDSISGDTSGSLNFSVSLKSLTNRPAIIDTTGFTAEEVMASKTPVAHSDFPVHRPNDLIAPRDFIHDLAGSLGIDLRKAKFLDKNKPRKFREYPVVNFYAYKDKEAMFEHCVARMGISVSRQSPEDGGNYIFKDLEEFFAFPSAHGAKYKGYAIYLTYGVEVISFSYQDGHSPVSLSNGKLEFIDAQGQAAQLRIDSKAVAKTIMDSLGIPGARTTLSVAEFRDQLVREAKDDIDSFIVKYANFFPTDPSNRKNIPRTASVGSLNRKLSLTLKQAIPGMHPGMLVYFREATDETVHPLLPANVRATYRITKVGNDFGSSGPLYKQVLECVK